AVKPNHQGHGADEQKDQKRTLPEPSPTRLEEQGIVGKGDAQTLHRLIVLAPSAASSKPRRTTGRLLRTSTTTRLPAAHVLVRAPRCEDQSRSRVPLAPASQRGHDPPR